MKMVNGNKTIRKGVFMSGCNVKRSVFILGSFFMLPLLSFADALLMKDGKAASHIMLSPKACIVEKHAADELAIFLGKIAKGERPAILSYGKKGKGVKIHFQLVKNKKIAREGFLTKIGKKEILISAVTPVGFIYGVYDLLRKYTGIRWLTPGEDGEYFKVQKTIAIPEGSYLSNPSFPYRNISWASASVLSDKWDSYDWMMRNHLRIYDAATIFNEWKQGKAKRSLKEELAKRDAILLEGGHCFSDLLGGRIFGSKKKEDGTIAFRKRLRQMYIDHPERFPLINGKRTFLDGHKYQPCTTNKDVKRIMAHTLYRYVTEVCSRTPYGSFRLVNNDGTSWCQCAECRKIDRGSNLMVNRYWSFINELGSMVWAKKPDALLNTIAYQNYEAPPKDILPDKRFASIGLSFNRICYRHRIDDPNCLTNRGYYAKYKGWQALAEKHGYTIYTYAQIDTMGNIFMPIEHIYSHDIKVYHKMGFKGLRPQLAPPDGRFGKLYDKRSPHPRLQWYGMWQSLYLFGALSWDVDADHLKLLEEANRLYYGEKAWKAGMKDFRSLLNKAFLETPGCSGHGHSSPLGRCMDRPGTLENLRKYLAAAEKAAGSDPDKRALFHVQREKTLFNATWERFRKEYLINYREIKSYRKQGKITIDGVLNEQDWKNADTISGFKRCYGDAPIRYQTFVRVTHEPENIYFGIECMEDDMKNLVEDVKKRDGAVWENNDVEIFLTHPDLGNKYYQIIVNSIGTVFDHFVSPGSPADKKFDSQIQVGIKKLKDRWVLECRIPTAPLGENALTVRHGRSISSGQEE